MGRAKSDDVRLEEPAGSAAHFLVRVEDAAVVLSDNDSANGPEVEGARLEAGVELAITAGQVFKAGRVTLTFEPRPDGRASGLREEEGWLLFNRPPRRTDRW